VLLYHGTALRHLPGIRREGIKPRGKLKGNWKHSVVSNPDNIYLTTAYPLYFAHNATKGDDDALMVLEIESEKLNLLNILPDEDFLEQATRKGGPAPLDKSMKVRTHWYRRRLESFCHLWKDSVDGLGTCCYRGTIPVAAIERVAVMSQGAYHKLVLVDGHDPTIFLMNYKLLGDKYRDFVRRLFAGELDATVMPFHKETVT